jgi:hypothetical protein
MRSSENLQKIFACFLGLSNQQPSREQSARIYSAITEYCEEEPSATRRSNIPESDIAHAEPGTGGIAEQDALSCIVVYAKLLHLRDRRSSPPVYRKFVARLHEEVDVFDEILMMKTVFSGSTGQTHKLFGRSIGVVDIMPLYPPRRNLSTSDLGRLNSPLFVEHVETEPSRLSQVVFTYLNAVQYGNEDLGFIIPQRCERAVMVIDLTSLSIPVERLLVSQPEAVHIRAQAEGVVKLKMPCVSGSTGAFIVDSIVQPHEPSDCDWDPDNDTLEAEDKIEVRFFFDWDRIAAS